MLSVELTWMHTSPRKVTCTTTSSLQMMWMRKEIIKGDVERNVILRSDVYENVIRNCDVGANASDKARHVINSWQHGRPTSSTSVDLDDHIINSGDVAVCIINSRTRHHQRADVENITIGDLYAPRHHYR